MLSLILLAMTAPVTPPPTVAETLSRYQRADMAGAGEILRDLERHRDLQTLKMLAESDAAHASAAAGKYARVLPARAAAEYVRSLPVASVKWHSAIWSFGCRPEPEVETYLREAIRMSDPDSRAMCYQIAARRRCPIFQGEAAKDLPNMLSPQLLIKGEETMMTVGDFAAHYLESITGRPAVSDAEKARRKLVSQESP